MIQMTNDGSMPTEYWLEQFAIDVVKIKKDIKRIEFWRDEELSKRYSSTSRLSYHAKQLAERKEILKSRESFIKQHTL